MNRSEKLALRVLSELLPEGSSVCHVQEQSHGEHDFNIYNVEGHRTGVVEVTAAIHEESMRSMAWERSHGPIKCDTLRLGWLLMAHNPNPRWVQIHGCLHLATLEQHGFSRFSHSTQYSEVEAVAQAVGALIKNGIENGGSLGTDGTVNFLTSRGEDNEPYVLSPESVTEVVFAALDKPDNLRKLSQENHPANFSRHFFIHIDRVTQPGPGYSILEGLPPKSPPDLEFRATHVWAACPMNDKVVVWRGDSSGWKSWWLEAESNTY